MNKHVPIIVALDVSTIAEAKKLVQTLLPTGVMFKIGKELFTSLGPAAVELVQSMGAKVFLDLKFHDIPNTVAKASQGATRLGVAMFNVHASGGRQMMLEAAKAMQKEAAAMGKLPPILLGVTVLTSLEREDLSEVGVEGSVEAQVERLARLAKECGLAGVVASPKEIALIRNTCGASFVIVTPGVRPEWASAGDQKRVMTPREAMTAGAHYLVIGRPITHATHPLDATEKILKEIGI